MDSKKTLIMVGIGLALLKLIVATLFIPSPTIFSDEYNYIKMAQSFSQDKSFSIHEQPTDAYPPLYPLFLSLGFVSDNMETNILMLQIINAILSTAIIIPVWLLAKEFLSEKKALMITALVAILPSHFSMANYFMSENLFYTLFLLVMYTVYKGIITEKKRYFLFAGVITALAYLTRTLGIVILGIVALAQGYIWYKERVHKKVLKNMAIFCTAFTVVAIPWVIRNYLLRQNTLEAVSGSYTKIVSFSTNSIASIFFWIMAYTGYLIVASLFLAIPIFMKKSTTPKEKIIYLLTIVSSIVFIAVAAKYAGDSRVHGNVLWLTGRPIGRYLDAVLPLIVLSGYLGLRQQWKRISFSKNFVMIFFIAVFALASFFRLFPVNNIAVSWLGAINYLIYESMNISLLLSVIVYALVIILFLFCVFFLFESKMFESKNIGRAIVIGFIAINILNIAVVQYNANTWYENEHAQLGVWMNKNIDPTAKVLIDSRDCISNELRDQRTLCNTKEDTALVDLWILNPTTIGDVGTFKNVDYIVTKSELEGKELLQKTISGTRLYRN